MAGIKLPPPEEAVELPQQPRTPVTGDLVSDDDRSIAADSWSIKSEYGSTLDEEQRHADATEALAAANLRPSSEYSSDKDSEKEDEEDGEGIASMPGLQSYWDATYSDELANFREHGHAGEIWFGPEVMDTVVSWTKSLCIDISRHRMLSHVDDDKVDHSENEGHDLSSWSVLDLGTGNGLLLQELAKPRVFRFRFAVYANSCTTTMATIVPTTEEDPALSVVRFVSELAWADAGAEVAEPQVARLCTEAQECMVMSRWLDLASLILTSADLVFSKVADKDVECIYTVICNLVTRSENPDEVLEIVKLVSAKLVQQPNEKPALRLKILFNLYNLLGDPYSRFYVYMKALHLAASGKVTEHVIPSFKKIDTFLKEWNIAVQDKRELFLAIFNILKESKSSGKESFSFLSNYLATFSPEDQQSMSEAKEEAVNAVIEFVKAPDMFQCDLFDMPAVAQLENDAKYSLIYQLLKIFLTQRLEAYLNFEAANSTLLKSHGLVHEDCIAKMRLMSLVDLASSESGQIPYALIKDSLRINDNEVEYWVVKAITAKLLDCKMDQMNQAVIVSRCTERQFGQLQWENLRSKLATWRGNVANVINTIQANKITEDAAQAMQSMTVR